MASKRHIFGSHVSCAGGLVGAVEKAAELECDCLQIFVCQPRRWPTAESCIPVRPLTKNNNQWNCKPLTDQQIEAWHAALRSHPMRDCIAHASYLINLAAPADELFQKSVDALIVEWQRADSLGLSGLVVHPGAFTTSCETEGLARIVSGVKQALDKTQPRNCRLLLENTAGQGSCLGHTFQQLGWLVEKIHAPESLGICLDTCHAFAAGYELNSKKGFQAMRKEIDAELPSGIVKALHLNDSKKPCGSRVDRHEHIGLGEIGDEGFRLVLGDKVLGRLPGYLETEKGDDENGEDWDIVNLRRLRCLSN